MERTDNIMRCLVVTAHPLEESLCKQLTEHVVNKLCDMGHEVVIEDLYAALQL